MDELDPIKTEPFVPAVGTPVTVQGPVDPNPEYDRNDDVVVNDQGGKQSRVDYAFTELEPDMLLRVTQVLHKGKAKYGAKNWRQIPYEDHLNHIAYHWTMLHQGDTSEDHLANIICRAMFAMYMKDKP